MSTQRAYARVRAEEGFTLVELLIVVAIIAILAAIAIPQFTKYRVRGYVTEINSDAKNAYTAAQAYLSDNPGGTLDSLTKIKVGGYQRSQNVQWVSGAMTITAGNIELKTTATGVTKNNALIHANGKINQAN